MTVATVLVPVPEHVPVGGDEVFLRQVRPSHVVPAVIGRQVDAVGFVVGRDDDTADVEHTMLAQVLFIDAQHVGRRGGVDFHVIVEGEALPSPRSRASLMRRITDLTNPLNRPSICCGETSAKFQGPIAYFTARADVSLPIALPAAKEQRVIDLLLRASGPMGEPHHL